MRLQVEEVVAAAQPQAGGSLVSFRRYDLHTLPPGLLYTIAAQRLRHNLRCRLANLGRNHPTGTCRIIVPVEFQTVGGSHC
ncbi:hypothetical protein J6590_069745 [Homalodisca vitripennis]|nr:hypothetical protein J6590_069745 [Homalodisca vitripennis]